MAKAKKKTKEASVKVPEFTRFKITKPNGGIMYRDKAQMGDIKLKRIKAKGWKVEEV